MNFSDERYVRLYTRDTITWKAIGWEGRCLLPLLLRKVDRAGVLDMDDQDIEGLAALVDIPADIAERGLAALLKRGVLTARGGALVISKFMDAQECKQSDAQRQRDSRERRRAGIHPVDSVTNRDQMSQPVTDGHSASRLVTLCCAVPSRAEPNQEETHTSAKTLPPTREPETSGVCEGASSIAEAARLFGPDSRLGDDQTPTVAVPRPLGEVRPEPVPDRTAAASEGSKRGAIPNRESGRQEGADAVPRGTTGARLDSGERDSRALGSALGASTTPDDSAISAWLAIEAEAGGPTALGVDRDFGQVQGIWLSSNKFQLWSANWRELRKAKPAPTLAECALLGRWIAAGGNGDITPWQLLCKAGGAENIAEWIKRAVHGNGKPQSTKQQTANQPPRGPIALQLPQSGRPKEQPYLRRLQLLREGKSIEDDIVEEDE